MSRGTGANVTAFKAGEMVIINNTSTGTCTTCVESTTAVIARLFVSQDLQETKNFGMNLASN